MVAAAARTVGADNNQQKAEAGSVQTAVMVVAGVEAAVAVAAAATAMAAVAAAVAAAAVAEAVAVAAAEMAATAAMVMAIASGGRDKREVVMWFHVYKIYTHRTWAGGTFLCCLRKVPLAHSCCACLLQELGWKYT